MLTRTQYLPAALAAILSLPTAAGTVNADGDLSRYMIARAVTCWATPSSLRGVRFGAEFDVSFAQDGQVDAINVMSVAPETETSQALASDFAAAFKRCGPYATEGVRQVSLLLSWPM